MVIFRSNVLTLNAKPRGEDTVLTTCVNVAEVNLGLYVVQVCGLIVS